MSLTRRTVLRHAIALPAAGFALSVPALASARQDGSYTSDAADVTLAWEAPWEEGVKFDNPGALPSLKTPESGALFNSIGADPLAKFPSWEANLDKAEEDYSTGFFVPMRDHHPDTTREYLAEERVATGYVLLFAYETFEDGPAFDYYEFRYDEDVEAMISVKFSDLADDFPEVFESLQESVTINGEPPFTFLDDDDILALL